KHKDAKKSNEMYYPRFTKVIINFFMTKDPSIPRRNKVNWHYVSDDQMFMTIKLVSRHRNIQHFDAMFPVELTNKDIRDSAAYKEYYVIASKSAPPKTKASVRKTRSSSDTTIPPPTIASTRLSTSVKGKQPAKSSKAKGISADITSKESTLQMVYDVLRLTPFFKAFLVIADVPEIYMEMLHICPRIPNQTFDELSFEEEILAFLRYLGYSGESKKIIDVNINKLHQPWRSFAAVINKCLSEKSIGYDSLRLSQA
nr:hypothetical protein [Tanacetum cinerariifolium]